MQDNHEVQRTINGRDIIMMPVLNAVADAIARNESQARIVIILYEEGLVGVGVGTQRHRTLEIAERIDRYRIQQLSTPITICSVDMWPVAENNLSSIPEKHREEVQEYLQYIDRSVRTARKRWRL